MLPFSINDESVHPIHLILVPIDNNIIFQLDFLLTMIEGAVCTIRHTYHIVVAIRWNQSMVTAKYIFTKTKQNSDIGSQPQTKTTSVTLNPNIRNAKIIENPSPTEFIEILNPTSSTFIQGGNKPL